MREGDVPSAAQSAKPKNTGEVSEYVTKYTHLGSQMPVLVEQKSSTSVVCNSILRWKEKVSIRGIGGFCRY
jgi:hypothetical protein